MPIGLDGGGLRSLLDPLGLFSRGGNNGVGTGMRAHPVHGGEHRGGHAERGQGQAHGVRHGGGNGPLGTPVPHAPPAPPVPHIPGLGTPGSQLAGNPVQHAVNMVGNLVHGSGAGSPLRHAATPGTPAFSGGPGQPAQPSFNAARQGPVAGPGATPPGAPAHSAAASVPSGPGLAGLPAPAALAGAVVSQLARAMNHGVQAAVLPSHVQGQSAVSPGVPFGGRATATGLPGPPQAAALPVSGHPAALRATDAPLVPRAPVQHAFQPAAVPRVPGQPVPVHVPAQTSSAPHPATPPAGMLQPGPVSGGHEARLASSQGQSQLQSQSPPHAQPHGRSVQAGLQANPVAQQAPANPAAQAAAGTLPAGHAAAVNQAAMPLVAALAGTTAEARVALQGVGQERTQVQLDQPASGHTAERGLRRSLRSRAAWARGSLLKMIPLAFLDPAHPQRTHGHTGHGGAAGRPKGGWFALPWLFWLLAVVAYGCLGLALIVMVGSEAAGQARPTSGWAGPLVLGCGLLAGLGAWQLARGRASRRSRRHR